MRDAPALWRPKPTVDEGEDAQRITTLIEDRSRNGIIRGVNQARLYEYPFFLTTDSPNNPITLSANGSSTLITGRVSASGPALVEALSVLNTGAALVQMQIMDGASPRTLMNYPMHINAIFGQNQSGGSLPYRLAEGIFVDENRSLDFVVADLSGSSNTIRVVPQTARYTSPQYDPQVRIIRERLKNKQFISVPFWMTTDGGAVTISASSTQVAGISIPPDAHFLCFKMSVVATSRLFTINLTNLTTGKSIIDGPEQANFEVSANLWLGDGNYPFVFPEPILFEAASKILVNLTDLSGSSNTVYLALHGSLIRTAMWQ